MSVIFKPVLLMISSPRGPHPRPLSLPRERGARRWNAVLVGAQCLRPSARLTRRGCQTLGARLCAPTPSVLRGALPSPSVGRGAGGEGCSAGGEGCSEPHHILRFPPLHHCQ